MHCRICLALLVCLVAPGVLRAQDPAAKAKAAPKSSANAAAFQKQFDHWKGLLDRLRKIQVLYKVAKPEDREPLREEFHAKLAEAEELAPQMTQGAEAVYAADPKNQEIADFLGAMARQERESDAYERALEIASLLIKNNYSKDEIYNDAGISAYEVADFDDAEKYLKEAEKRKVALPTASHYLAQLPEEREKWNKEVKIREAEAKANDLPRVLFKTNKGDITIELFENEAPNTVANFINLVERKFYDGLTFHRVLGGFMAQAGCPVGDGTGGPGYHIKCECYEPNARMHFRGSLSMAHAGRDTGGSQFFLTFRPTDHLDGRHTVFGRVIKGMDVLAKLQKRDPTGNDPAEPDKIITATVLRKRDHEYKPVKVGDEPAKPAEEKKPAAEDKKPADEKKSAAEEKKPAAEGKKPTEEKKPAAEGKKPADGTKKPATEEKKPAEEKKPGDK